MGIALLAVCLLLAGCGRREPGNRGLQDKLATSQGDLVRWAVADSREIESAIIAWSQGRIAEALNAENLSAAETEQLRNYEALDRQLMEMVTQRSMDVDPSTGLPREKASEREKELSNRVSQARVPIAHILDRRERQETRIRNQYSAKQLTAEYVRDRFDLVIDSSEMHSFNSPVLFRRPAEAVDITEGIIKLFKEKSKP